jgi:hypothetical protein
MLSDRRMSICHRDAEADGPGMVLLRRWFLAQATTNRTSRRIPSSPLAASRFVSPFLIAIAVADVIFVAPFDGSAGSAPPEDRLGLRHSDGIGGLRAARISRRLLQRTPKTRGG